MIGGLLGRGGMGEVRVAWDSKLGRDVAMKTARPDDADAAQRLSREAALTARLEHPNIVPVYSSGRDRDGQPFYTMRVLPGRSLAEAILEAGGQTGRLALVRHVLDAAEALAFAHGRGVIHRDLKPANIMVGAFGETLVADWGLACTLDEVGTVRGGGTPGYMSPEQGRGALLDVRTDVYGLGAVLYELLVGSAPPPAIRGPVPPVRTLAPTVPVELAAIADRALQADPDARYPSARAFADDLLAWFEGRRVAAHDYSVRDVLRRVWAASRGPILVGAAGLVALGLAVGIGWYRTATERGRAQISEVAAVEARHAEERALADALLTQALAAADADQAMEAEILAVESLVRQETPQARGVLARFADRPRVALIARSEPIADCMPRALSPDGSLLLCGRRDGVRLVDPLHPSVATASVAGAYMIASFAGDSEHVLLANRAGQTWIWRPPAAPQALAFTMKLSMHVAYSAVPGTVPIEGSASTFVLDLGSESVTQANICAPGVDRASALAADGTLFTGCADRRILRSAPGGPLEQVTRLEERDDIQVMTLAAGGRSDGELIIGTLRGAAIFLRPDGTERTRFQVGSEAMGTLLPIGDRIAAMAGAGSLRVWNMDTGLSLGRLSAAHSIIAWREGGEVLRIVGAQTEDRRVPVPSRPHLLPVPAGVGGLAISPDGDRVAIALGDGSVQEMDLVDGHLIHRWRWQDGVAKDVSYRADGARIASAVASNADQRVTATESGENVEVYWHEKMRRAVFLRSGWLLGAPYEGGMFLWREGEAGTHVLLDAPVGELEPNASGTEVAAIDDNDVVWRIVDGPTPTVRRVGVVPNPTTAATLGPDTLVSTQETVLRLDPGGKEVGRWSLDAIVTDIATSADARFLAAGQVDGQVVVWRIGQDAPIARMIGHVGRVGALAFSADGRWLISGGWDDAVRVWSLASLEEPAEALRTRIEGAWGRSLKDVLSSP